MLGSLSETALILKQQNLLFIGKILYSSGRLVDSQWTGQDSLVMLGA
jgi:hypothetical protein